MAGQLNIVQISVADQDRDAVIEILEEALEKARAGEVNDVAVVMSVLDDDGPQFWFQYHGERSYATLLAGVSALEFDLHYRRYVED